MALNYSSSSHRSHRVRKATSSRKEKKKATVAQEYQRKHWERTGQIASCLGLINYNLNVKQSFLPQDVAHYLRIAQVALQNAQRLEARKNEFINLDIAPSWKSGNIK